MKIRRPFIQALLIILGGVLFAQAPDGAANDAVGRLESALGGGTVRREAPAQVSRGGREPAWVGDPYTAYSRDRYLAAVGHGFSRTEAEIKAFATLTAFFGQSIRSDYRESTIYAEALSKGIVSSAKTTSISGELSASTSMDNLIGAEIGYVWDDGRSMVYAAAYMDREKTAASYTELIAANQRTIAALTALSSAERNGLEGYARYNLAAAIAAINANYANVIYLAAGPERAAALGLKSPGSYTLEAAEILKRITVAVKVENDRNDRIRDALAKTLSAKGLRTGGNDPRYELEGQVTFTEAVLPNSTNKFCRYVLSANLIENETRAVLLSFNSAGRVGHRTYENAEVSAVIAVERVIAEEYPAVLEEYLAALLPQKKIEEP